jgi:hypothetical protein
MDWFAAIAERLLARSTLVVGGKPYRFHELEFYYHGREHADPFTHRDPWQQTCARWYFHRDGGTYRGGTYKGLDITFGPEGDYGGILVRSLGSDDGELINGCSLCVDRLLACTGYQDVASLARAVEEHPIDTTTSALTIRDDETIPPAGIWRSARVGLTLKRVERFPEMVGYIARPYRFLDAPRQIHKGRLQLAIALHEQGKPPAEIAAITGSPRRVLETYIAAYEEGCATGSIASFTGKALAPIELCRLYGTIADTTSR